MADTDIDRFIQEQKSRLANERQNLSSQNKMATDEQYRRKWQKVHGTKHRLSSTKLRATEHTNYDKPQHQAHVLSKVRYNPNSPPTNEADSYKEIWTRLHPDQPMDDHRSSRLQTDEQKTNQRNQERYYTEKQEAEVPNYRQKDLDEYLERWRQLHPDKHPNNYPDPILNRNVNGHVSNRGYNDSYSNTNGYDYPSPRSNREVAMDAQLKGQDDYRKIHQQVHANRNNASNYTPRQVEYKNYIIDESPRLQKKRLEEQARNQEYNQLQTQKRGFKGLRDKKLAEQTDEYKANAAFINASDADKIAKEQQRNKEFREWQKQDEERYRNRFEHKKPQKQELANERRQDYNNMLSHQGPGRVIEGWTTPTDQEANDRHRARRAPDSYDNRNGYGPSSGANNTSLNVGSRESNSARVRAKEAYKAELQQQISDKRRQDANGRTHRGIREPEVRKYHQVIENLLTEDKNRNTGMLLGNREDTSIKKSRNRQMNELYESRNRFKGSLGDYKNRISGTGAGIPTGVGTRAGAGTGSGSILDDGLQIQFDQILGSNNRVATLEPPASLMYQPSTYVTANAVTNVGSSLDDAYNFYGSRNPLDPELNAAAVPGRAMEGFGGGGVPSLNLDGLGGDGPSSPRRGAGHAAAHGMDFGSDDHKKREQKSLKDEYREELERQMKEKASKKRREKEEQERYDIMKEEEARNYDPYGKGGGGAPMRDPQGNVISDLRQMRHNNINASNRNAPKVTFSPRFAPNTFGNADQSGNQTVAANSYRDDLIKPPPAQTTAEGEASFARGGHGIFGMPKTDAEKIQAERYKYELQRQIDEKKADAERKRLEKQLEDEREQKMIDEQRARMQADFEEEQRRIKEKEDEARRKNEEMMREAEDRRREQERLRQEQDERRREELRENREREREERERMEAAKRSKSPPIPALRTNEQSKQATNRMANSPIVPAARTRTAEIPENTREESTRAQSADVLNQLAQMRAQLQNERKRVQTMLDDQENDVEIYDPRQVHRPPPAPIVHSRADVNVFETAINRNPVAVRRTPGDRANPEAAEDFNALKHKGNTDSRRQFRQMYPQEPSTSDALETQQSELLRQQEERLRYLKDRRELADTSTLRLNRDITSSSSQLYSNSTFVDANGVMDLPDDFEDIPRRNNSARQRRRTRVSSSPRIDKFSSPDYNSRNTFGSQTSLNVDKLSRKNEDRLRKLRDLQGDDISLYEPEDVLDRFMSKQAHNRPPSRHTLLDETWLRTGTDQSRF